jgi:general secretion pathway protein H
MRARGFTLLELLVVMAVIGLVLALMPGFLFRDQPAIDLENAARAVADGLRQTRSRAMLENRAQTFALDVASRRFRPGDGQPLRQLDRAIALSLLTARSEAIGDVIGRIRFFPDGSATGGRVRLALEGHEAEVRIDWLTGDVVIDEPGA